VNATLLLNFTIFPAFRLSHRWISSDPVETEKRRWEAWDVP
jgi:hypothetical protein